jgi:hypothetical protein
MSPRKKRKVSVEDSRFIAADATLKMFLAAIVMKIH